ncbi:SRPBCC domain-containing protein [Candidatus Daviesbacteria bacterium]|nr:SRPBCC domain-containing protein [Candidatus Daviesbacteria bacterium]
MKSIKQTYLINSSLDKVWQALVEVKEIENWGAGPAQMKGLENFNFKLWGGDIHGKNIQIIKNKKLVQEWFGGDWDRPSIVTFNLSRDKNGTKIELIQTNVPDSEVNDLENGWKRYYLGEIKKYLERR